MENTDFQNIINKHIAIGPVTDQGTNVFFRYQEAMKEVWNLAVDKCAETAKIHWKEEFESDEIDEQSILKNKI